MIFRVPTAVIACLLAAGCSSKTPTVPNPFSTADRVPPPALQSVPGAAQPYYQGGGAPPTFVPGQTTPSGYPAAPVPSFGAPAPSLQPGPGQATPVYGTPSGSASKPAPRSTQLAAGDAVAIPTDAGSLRFATSGDAERLRQASAPIARESAPTQLAAKSPTRPPATANAWIAGSAPVRPAAPAVAPRVRMPGEREPVSLAAIDGRVPVAPLEPAASSQVAGEPAPLRVATPPSTLGWR